jgi:hypothetical protein
MSIAPRQVFCVIEHRHRNRSIADEIFVAGEYWLIEDRLEAREPHCYELRFHLAPSAHGKTAIHPTTFGATVDAPEVSFVVVTRGLVTLEDGWIAPHYGTKLPAPVIVVTQRESAVVEFLTLVAPKACVRPSPSLSVVESDGVRIATVHGVGAVGLWRDRVAWSLEGGEESMLDCRAAAAWVRESENGRRGPHAAMTVNVAAPAQAVPEV